MKKEINIYLCDDNRFFAEKICENIARILNNKREYKLTIFDNGRELINMWKQKFSDAVFLDIDMPELDGFEVAEMLQDSRKNALIIFVTNHEDKVYQSWKYQPFWFVRKSHMEDLDIVLPRLLAKIDAQYEKEGNFFNLQCENFVVEIDINLLMYIESFKHDIIIHYKDKKQQIRCKISNAEEQLSFLNIIRVQNGFLVNCRFVSKITSREVILTNGYKINLSRDRINYAREEFQRFLRSR